MTAKTADTHYDALMEAIQNCVAAYMGANADCNLAVASGVLLDLAHAYTE